MNNTSSGPLSCARAFEEELRKLRPDALLAPSGGRPEPLERLQHVAHSQRLTALSLSGGGIRSATFALGVIEGLCRRGLVESFDYLSTVSGGGYAGGWLSAWRYHATAQKRAVAWPEKPAEPGGPAEPESLMRLRKYSRYLAPHTGAFSVDLWAMLATIARNLLLIWLVLLPIIAALLLLPNIYFGVIRAAERDLVATARFTLEESSTWLLLVCCALLALSIGFIVRDLPSLGARRSTQRQFLVWCLLPLCLGALGLTIFWDMDEVPVTFGAAILSGALAHPLAWAIAGLGTDRKWRPRTWMAAAISASVAASGMWALATGSFGFGHPLEVDYATLAFPLVLGIIALATVLQIGLSREETGDEDLEWWSRFGAWLLIVMVAWLVASVVVLCAPRAIRWIVHETIGLAPVAGLSISGVLGLATSLLGAVAARAGRVREAGDTGMLNRLAAAVAVPGFVLLLLTFLASLNLDLLRSIHDGHLAVGVSLDAMIERAWLAESVVLLGALTGLGLLMALFVPVNKYSLNGMYKNRLIRAFIGASRPHAERRPSPFTDFDPADDLSMAALASLPAPLHIVNVTLNMVSDRTLAMQQRKSESFTLSPLHSGSWSLGYRPSAGYACEKDRPEFCGVTLGTALTISGAAASPNMGARSTPALTFLLTLFNARLGAWLGNPGRAGESAWRDAEPRVGPGPLLRELFGLTSDRSPYVFLSDGGHFENLGLYEMVRRRCHFIIVSDAGCDPGYAFEDLSNAVRKIRIDFSIPIEFPATGIGMDHARQGNGNPHFAVGAIRYSAVDGAVEDGVLLYMKATLSGDEPADVLNYARSHPLFPHESTANQFFTEAQFESYRMLGLHTIEHALTDPGVQEVLQMCRRHRAQGSGITDGVDARSAARSAAL